MPIDTYQISLVSLQDTFSVTKDKINTIIAVVNGLPSAKSGGFPRLGGTTDGLSSGLALPGTIGDMYVINTGGIGIGDFLDTTLSQPTTVTGKLQILANTGYANVYIEASATVGETGGTSNAAVLMVRDIGLSNNYIKLSVLPDTQGVSPAPGNDGVEALVPLMISTEIANRDDMPMQEMIRIERTTGELTADDNLGGYIAFRNRDHAGGGSQAWHAKDNVRLLGRNNVGAGGGDERTGHFEVWTASELAPGAAGDVVIRFTANSSMIESTVDADSSALHTGGFVHQGGMSIAKKLYVGDVTHLLGSDVGDVFSASITEGGALRVITGGASIKRHLAVGGKTTIYGTGDAVQTSSDPGNVPGVAALTVKGGIAVGGAASSFHGVMWINGAGSPSAGTGTTEGALRITAGGLVVNGNIRTNDSLFVKGVGVPVTDTTGVYEGALRITHGGLVVKDNIRTNAGLFVKGVGVPVTDTTGVAQGALIVTHGGLVVKDNIRTNAGLFVRSSGTPDHTAAAITSAGALRVPLGGASIQQHLAVGGKTAIYDTGAAVQTSSNPGNVPGAAALTVKGGIAVGGHSSFHGAVWLNYSGTNHLVTNIAGIAEGALRITSGGLVVNENIRTNAGLFVRSITGATQHGEGAVQIAGGASIAENLYVGGTIYASGGTVGTSVVAGLTVDAGDAEVYNNTFLATADNTKYVEILSTLSRLTGGPNPNNEVGNETAETSKNSLMVNGGVGIGSNLYVKGGVSYLNSSASDGALVVQGGALIVKDVNIGTASTGMLVIHNTTGSVVHTSGQAGPYGAGSGSPITALNCRGGALFGQNVKMFQNLYIRGSSAVTDTTGVAEGALRLTSGGLVVNGNIRTNAGLFVRGSGGVTDTTGVGQGALIVSVGGLVVNENIRTNAGLFVRGSGGVTDTTGVAQGALRVTGGGLLVAGSIRTNSDLYVRSSGTPDHTAAAITSAGALRVPLGGASILQHLAVGGKTAIYGTGHAIQTSSNPSNPPGAAALTVKGGIAAGGHSSFHGAVWLNHNSHVDNIAGTGQGALRITAGGLVVNGNIKTNNELYVRGGTTSTTSTTGAVQIAGGVGITENLNVGSGGVTKLWNTTGGGAVGVLAAGLTTWAATASTTGSALHVVGGTYHAGHVQTAGNLIVGTGATYVDQAGSRSDGQLRVRGGAGITHQLHVGEYGEFGASAASAASLIDGQSAATGTLRVTGGATITDDSSFGNRVHIDGTEASTNTTTGALRVRGGVGVRGRMNVAGRVQVSDSGSVTNTTGVGEGALRITAGGLVVNQSIRTNAGLFVRGAGVAVTNIAGTGQGALIVSVGGLVVNQSIRTNAGLFVRGGTTSTTSTTGAVQIDGGVGITENLNVGSGGVTKLWNTASGSSESTGNALQVEGSAGIRENLNVGITGITRLLNSADAGLGDGDTPGASGALRVTGGVGITRALAVGGIARIYDNTESISGITGALVVDGGVGIGQNLTVAAAGRTYLLNTTPADPASAAFADGGALHISAGGASIKQGLVVGGKTTIYNGDNATQASSNPGNAPGVAALTVKGGIAVGNHSSFHQVVWINGGGNPTNTADASFTQGALRITSGGLVVNGNIRTNAGLFVRGGTTSTTSTTGAVQIAGGVGITENLNVGSGGVTKLWKTTGNISTQAALTSWLSTAHTTTGSALHVVGGTYHAGHVYTAGNLIVGRGTGWVDEAEDSDSGALRVRGGAGITRQLHVGGAIVAEDSSAVTNIAGTAEGALIVSVGGLVVNQNIRTNAGLFVRGAGVAVTNTTGVAQGALIVSSGGLVVNQNIRTNSELYVRGSATPSSTAAAIASTGALRVPVGGASIKQHLAVGGKTAIYGTGHAIQTSSNPSNPPGAAALTVKGGIAAGGHSSFHGAVWLNYNSGVTNIAGTAEGALRITAGGLVVNGNIKTNNELYVRGSGGVTDIAGTAEGALRLTFGGLVVQGNIRTNSELYVRGSATPSSTAAAITSAGALRVPLGGASIKQHLAVGGKTTIYNGDPATQTSSNPGNVPGAAALTVKGGIAVGHHSSFNQVVWINGGGNPTNTTGVGEGALRITAGGLVVNQNIRTNAGLFVRGTTDATDALGTSGALQVLGGASIKEKLYVGGATSLEGTLDVTGGVVTITPPSPGPSLVLNNGVDLGSTIVPADYSAGWLHVNNGSTRRLILDPNQIQVRSSSDAQALYIQQGVGSNGLRGVTHIDGPLYANRGLQVGTSLQSGLSHNFTVLGTTKTTSKVVLATDQNQTANVSIGAADADANRPSKLSVHGAIAISEQSSSQADATTHGGYGQVWVKNDAPTNLMYTDDVGTDFVLNAPAYPKGHIRGFIYNEDAFASNSWDLFLSAGECADSTGTYNLDIGASGVKRMVDNPDGTHVQSEWGPGDLGGGLPSPLTFANDTWYCIHVIGGSGATTDYGLDTDTDANNLLTRASTVTDNTYDKFRHVGWVRWLSFGQGFCPWFHTESDPDVVKFPQPQRSVNEFTAAGGANQGVWSTTTTTTKALAPPDTVLRAVASVRIENPSTAREIAFLMSPLGHIPGTAVTTHSRYTFAVDSGTGNGAERRQSTYFEVDLDSSSQYQIDCTHNSTTGDRITIMDQGFRWSRGR